MAYDVNRGGIARSVSFQSLLPLAPGASRFSLPFPLPSSLRHSITAYGRPPLHRSFGFLPPFFPSPATLSCNPATLSTTASQPQDYFRVGLSKPQTESNRLGLQPFFKPPP